MQVVNATKSFGGLTAVDNVSFNVEKGELLGVIGPNGSGKTTLINLISGTHPITSGDILYNGSSIKKYAPYQRARLGIARTFQVVKPLQDLTAEDNIMTAALFGRSKSNLAQEVFSCMSTKPAKIAYVQTENILERIGLQDQKNRFARNLTLSGQKRLAVGQALAMNPQLLLLDEVVAGLNLSEVEDMMGLITTINNEGVTVIMIEHIMKVVMGISHRVIVLDRGALIANDLPELVAHDPHVIAAYLGSRFGNKNKGGEGHEHFRS